MAVLKLRNILLRMEYRGTDFAGWQIQARGRTVQGVLKENLQRFLREDVKPVGSGRTDSGVHALAQYANFRTSNRMSAIGIMSRLNRMLPGDIVITGCREVPLNFNSPRDAASRSYRYLITERPSALNKGISWVLGRQLDLPLLKRMAGIVRKSTQFGNFCKVKSRMVSNECKIMRSDWSRYGGYLRFEIAANRFLHNMVRLLVGTMVAVADGKMELSRFRMILRSKVDEKTKFIAPANGLYLVGVQYKEIKL
jgi:tRNA pseudouridine38-40 synthase